MGAEDRPHPLPQFRKGVGACLPVSLKRLGRWPSAGLALGSCLLGVSRVCFRLFRPVRCVWRFGLCAVRRVRPLPLRLARWVAARLALAAVCLPSLVPAAGGLFLALVGSRLVARWLVGRVALGLVARPVAPSSASLVSPLPLVWPPCPLLSGRCSLACWLLAPSVGCSSFSSPSPPCSRSPSPSLGGLIPLF